MLVWHLSADDEILSEQGSTQSQAMECCTIAARTLSLFRDPSADKLLRRIRFIVFTPTSARPLDWAHPTEDLR